MLGFTSALGKSREELQVSGGHLQFKHRTQEEPVLLGLGSDLVFPASICPAAPTHRGPAIPEEVQPFPSGSSGPCLYPKRISKCFLTLTWGCSSFWAAEMGGSVSISWILVHH